MGLYKVVINTAGLRKNKLRRKSWERRLAEDFASVIHGREFICENEEDLQNRIEFIAGKSSDTDAHLRMASDAGNYVTLQTKEYGKHRLPIAMYGIAQGYVSCQRIIAHMRRHNRFTLPFRAFYDLRQADWFRGCFVEIRKIGKKGGAAA
jgi:hypothetical protein